MRAQGIPSDRIHEDSQFGKDFRRPQYRSLLRLL